VEQLVRELVIEIGEDPDREGLVRTPERVARAWEFLSRGYGMDPRDVVGDAVFTQETSNMITVRDIGLSSMWEHHMLPFYGRCHVGYISKGKVPGLSKVARLVDVYARRLQIQERLTEQIAPTSMDEIDAEGVGVVIEARHLCMMMRGVEKQNSLTTTSSVLGSFHNSAATRAEFMTLSSKPRSAAP